MRELFIKIDGFLESKTKRERMILFLLPIVVFLGIVLGFVMPSVDMIYAQNKALLQEQTRLSLTLNNANKQTLQDLSSQLESKETFFQKLKSKRIISSKLSKLLEPLCKTTHSLDSNLSFYAIGDVGILEDILEEIEKNYFVFIKSMSLNAHFSTDLEMKFDVVNVGETL